jgi:hypothetical protein
MALVQKVIPVPPSAPGKVQHLLADASVQSVATVHSRTILLPVHELLSVVVHALAAVHAVTAGSEVQLGIVPPVRLIVAQQIGEALGQFAGAEHAELASPGIEASPPPLLLPLPPLLLPLLAPPLLLPPPPLLLPPPASGVADGVLLLHARKPTNRNVATVIEQGTERALRAFIGESSDERRITVTFKPGVSCAERGIERTGG